jgi:hypothetical protein
MELLHPCRLVLGPTLTDQMTARRPTLRNQPFPRASPPILDHVQALAAFARMIDSQDGYDKNFKLGCRVVGLVSTIPDLALYSF